MAEKTIRKEPQKESPQPLIEKEEVLEILEKEIPSEVKKEKREIKEKKEIPQVEKTKEIPIGKPSPLSFLKKKPRPILEKSETLMEIEKILTEGLESVYQTMPEAIKEKFKRKGEEAASKIEKLITAVKIKVNKILRLIINWLKVIPGVNKFFLEQESKIKTDKILKLAERKRKQKLES